MPAFMEPGLEVIAQAIAVKRGDDSYLTGNTGGEPFVTRLFAMRAYCWCDGYGEGHEDGCPPNFEFYPTGLQVCWYKHAGRSASVNQAPHRRLWLQIVTTCVIEELG